MAQLLEALANTGSPHSGPITTPLPTPPSLAGVQAGLVQFTEPGWHTEDSKFPSWTRWIAEAPAGKPATAAIASDSPATAGLVRKARRFMTAGVPPSSCSSC